MSDALQKSEQDQQRSAALIDTVRKTIFPDATDPELALFFHKCQSVGVNPLDQLIHPTKYRQKDGSSKVTFITSINLLRSKSSATGEYDGMDEPEYEGDSSMDHEGNTIQVPDICKVKVYRKGISRPFVGVARWREYYPGDLKGHQWRARPFHMLAKCAEALARRLAFPDQLNMLYTDEEMMQATEQIAGVTSTKPKVNPEDVKPRTTASQSQQEPENQEYEKHTGTVADVSIKTGTGKRGTWTKYGVKIGDTFYGTFDESLGKAAQGLKGKKVTFAFTSDGQYQTLTSIVALQEAAGGPKAGAGVSKGGEAVEDAESFATSVFLLGSDMGLTPAKINDILQAEFSCSLGTIPADSQKAVLDHFQTMKKGG